MYFLVMYIVSFNIIIFSDINVMYTLLHGLYKHVTQKDEFFVLILGLDNAGKTTFLESAKTRDEKYENLQDLFNVIF